ncbi:thioredoxin [Leishmania donovani]|uniref:Thioredoxin n=3 Tax=Leishmania donovani species complex TaxID=38574 RepID=A0A6L0WR01_LEIIN|nr:putative thioredoxin [Leishmania infantum JPCM5]XP_003857840.1 thioredoxin, putative [Leishmania donovani]CAC9436539.1 thioredoxin_-_putative [Leishmania infantum]AYU75538.1 thioredoxin, putative [Leishmania donovani]TPP49182.1 Thioredoxin family protein [Leishmania donovani]TPP54550.1 Thioredoxin family protein [Leishmania donovani]CAJ1985612.1 thioredoxin [Leishmania donovani]|eukprot:XP_001462640.1 putative thioredoxin [Leishmania infantum JPCM5]
MPFTEVYGVEQFRDIANDPTLTVVCFSAVWCGPCKTIEKDLDRLTYEFANVRFAKVDADNNTEIVSKCRVMQLPTFMLVRAGQMLGYVIGADLAQLKAKIREEANKS